MQSRTLLSKYVYGSFLIPPRTTWDVLSSAGKACVTLLTSQADRDNFVATLNKGIINPPVLSQANFGTAMVLALYNDLNSPLFKKHSFSIEDFTAGAKPALERFHDVQVTLRKIYHKEESEELAGDGLGTDETVTGDARNQAKGDKTGDAAPAWSMDDAKMMLHSMGIFPEDKVIDAVMKRDWAKEAEDDPESLVAQLKAMVTPEYFKVVDLSTKCNFIFEKQNNFSVESGSITNMALLSARAMEKPLLEESHRDDVDPDAPLQDESPSNRVDKDPPVAAQVEVLYDIEQIFTEKEMGEDGSYRQLEVGKPTRKTQVLVAVFQGWLHGDPDGNESIRWKLALDRPAFEFPYLINRL